MTEFNDFHVVLKPNLQMQGTWDVELQDCPINGLVGPKGSLQPTVTEQQLLQLRNQNKWPNLAALKTIGQSVWQSLMTPTLEAAFINCLQSSKDDARGMRLVVSLIGEEAQAAAPGTIRLQEFPVEALYLNTLNFIAPNIITPISRSLNFKPDIEPERVTLPLRILVVVATPQDKIAANIQEEKNVIKKALKKLTGPGGAIELTFCTPPTRNELATLLQNNAFHVLHFVGHGAFDIVGDDPSPRPHLCLEDDEGQSDPVDAETFEIMMQNTGVRLVVMTACASAQPLPEQVQSVVGPFNGLAQRLVAGVSGVSAVVAMQFDLESEAAVVFSRTYYTKLLVSGLRLDEVVAACRKALATEMNAGHRAWVTPVLFWRCIDGKVFDISPLKQSLDLNTQKRLQELDTIVGVYKENINGAEKSMATSPEIEVRNALTPLVAEWQVKIDQFEQERGQLLGDTLRLHGGRLRAGESIACRLTIRLRTQSKIEDVSAIVRFPADKVTFKNATAGSQTPGSVPLIGAQSANELRVLLSNVSQGASWAPGEYELALLNFQVQAGVTTPILELSLDNAVVESDGGGAFGTLSAILFVSK